MRTAVGAGVLGLLLAGSASAGGTALTQAIEAGEAALGLRYRFEHVRQEGYAEDARASTLRLRLGYETGSWRRWKAVAELDYVGEILFDEFDSGGGTSPDRIRYPLVADPEGADLNQLYAELVPAPGWRWRFGRQRILLDDQRFVGGVGWRQNEQTYDAVSVAATVLDRVELFYGFVANANRIFGDRVPAGDHRMATHLVNARIAIGGTIALTPYLYRIDNDDDPAASTSTAGVRIAGSRAFGAQTLEWVADVAHQRDAGGAPAEFETEYFRLDLRWRFPGGLDLGAGLESLGGRRDRPGGAFRTPLATLHAFQGWADQFTATPDAGVRDLFAKAWYMRGPWRLEAAWHDFSAESGGQDYGKELDLAAGRQLGDRYAVLLKAAFFDASGDAFRDTDKLWLMLTAAW